ADGGRPRHNNRQNTSVFQIKIHIAHKSKPFAISDINDLPALKVADPHFPLPPFCTVSPKVLPPVRQGNSGIPHDVFAAHHASLSPYAKSRRNVHGQKLSSAI